MKKVTFIRHGRKDGELIAADQLTEIQNNGINGLNGFLQPGQEIVIGLGSELVRTQQTIEAFQAYMEKNGFIPAQILAPEKRFGNAELFNKMVSNEALMAEVKISGWYSALCSLEPKLLESIQEDQFSALQAIFEVIKDNDVDITIGHTPMIELLAIYVDAKDSFFRNKSFGIPESLSLKELQGVEFSQDNDDIIHVTGLLG